METLDARIMRIRKKSVYAIFVGTAYRRNGYVSEAVKKYISYIDDEKEELYRFYVIRRQ